MVRVTNNLGLPESIVRAVQNDPYDRGNSDISVTGLIGPARKRMLQMRHADELEVDASDRIWSLYGQIVHGILDRADLGDDQIITERRLFIERHGWRISGQFDRLVLKSATILQDYKFTSLWAVKELKPEHEAQGNIYRLMLKEHGYHVDAIQIVNILRDWSKVRAANDPSHPQKPVVILDVPVWDDARTEAYITDRLMAHGNAQTNLPDCSPDERWERESVWKVKKKGNKTAVRGHANHESEASAKAAAAELTRDTNTEHVVEFHQGEQTRCALYCEASPFCDQWKKSNPNKLGL